MFVCRQGVKSKPTNISWYNWQQFKPEVAVAHSKRTNPGFIGPPQRELLREQEIPKGTQLALSLNLAQLEVPRTSILVDGTHLSN